MKILKVLMIPDSYGWAYYFTAKGVQKYSKHDVTVRPIKGGNLTPQLIRAHDVVFIFSRWVWNRICRYRSLILAVREKPSILYCCGTYFGKPPSCVNVYGVCTERLVTKCKAMGIKNVALLREGVDTEIFRPYPKLVSPQLRVGWAGNPGKRVKRFHLVKYIKYPVKVMAQHSKKYRVKNRSRKPMVDFYNNLDVYVMMMAQDGVHGVGLTLMEAMSCGLPVISTDIAGVSELVPREWLVPAMPEKTVIKEVNRKLALLDKNRNLLKKVGVQNRELILKTRSWKIRVKDWDRILGAVAGND